MRRNLLRWFLTAATLLDPYAPSAQAGLPVPPDTSVTCQLSPTGDGRYFFALIRDNRDDGTTYFGLICGDAQGMIRGFTCPNHKWPAVFTDRPYEPQIPDTKTKAYVFQTSNDVAVAYKCHS